MKHLEIMFDRIQDGGLELKPQKCHFGLEEIFFLGHLLIPQV